MNDPLIVSDPAVMMGKPVVAGTRITVDLILEKLASGESSKAETVAKVLRDHAAELPCAFTVISPGAVRIRKPPDSG